MGKKLHRIYLLGFMGSGKSYLAHRLSRISGLPFVDLDELISHRQQMSITQIFKRYGEAFFRKEEAEVLHHTAAWNNCLIACGGGTPCYGNNMDWILQHGLSVFIDPEEDLLLERLRRGQDRRPLLRGLDEPALRLYIRGKLSERRPFYERADLVFRPDKSEKETERALWKQICEYRKNQGDEMGSY
jgi:shikimate kinase